jgi:hypothetical protein
MPIVKVPDGLTIEDYANAFQAFHGVVGVVLFEFAREEIETRDIISRNLIARSDTLASSILRLWAQGDYHGCYILFRCLLERLFHLRHLKESNSFEEFEAWSFNEEYKAVNRVRSDQSVEGAREAFIFTAKQKSKAYKIKVNPPEWERPKAEEIAKQMGTRFLYKYGYDYASSHVHPMASDGQIDFHRITNIEPETPFPDQKILLHDTLLVATLIVQDGLDSSTMSWRAILYNALGDLREFLESGSLDYQDRVNILYRTYMQGTRMYVMKDAAASI